MNRNVEVSRDFLLELYKISSAKYRRIIIAEVPDLFEPELEIKAGEWYVKIWYDGDYDIFRVDSVSDGKYSADDYYFRNGERIISRPGKFSIDELISEDRHKLFAAEQCDLQTVMDSLSNEARRKIRLINDELESFEKSITIKSDEVIALYTQFGIKFN